MTNRDWRLATRDSLSVTRYLAFLAIRDPQVRSANQAGPPLATRDPRLVTRDSRLRRPKAGVTSGVVIYGPYKGHYLSADLRNRRCLPYSAAAIPQVRRPCWSGPEVDASSSSTARHLCRCSSPQSPLFNLE